MYYVNLLCCLVLTAGVLGAAERERRGDPISRNGEMERPAETETAWSAQSPAAATDAAPVFTGLYLWRGRADRDYKPFHQWELRLEGGTQRVRDLKLRVIPLGNDLEPLLGRKGHWAEIGSLGRGEEIDFSYKLNTSAPAAIEVEAEWDGGSATYMSSDHSSLPYRFDPDAEQAQLVALPPDFQYLKRKRKAGVVFILINKGELPATGVSHRIMLKNEAGEVVKEVEHVPTEDGVVPPGFEEEIKLIIDDAPPFKTVAIATSTAEDGAGGGFDPGEFTGIADVEVAHVAVEDGTVSADVRNGLDHAVSDLVITLDLLDSGGASLASVDIPVGELAAGAEQSISGEVGEVADIGGWSVGMAFGGGPAESTEPTQVAIEPIVVEGLELAVRKVHPLDGAVQVDVTFTNQRDADLAQLTAEVGLQGPGGQVIAVPVTLDALPQGTAFDAGLVAEGIEDVQGVRLQWSTGGE